MALQELPENAGYSMVIKEIIVPLWLRARTRTRSLRTRVCIRKADSVGVRFLFVYAYSVFSSMIGFIYPFAARFFLLAPFHFAKIMGKEKKYSSYHVKLMSPSLPLYIRLFSR